MKLINHEILGAQLHMALLLGKGHRLLPQQNNFRNRVGISTLEASIKSVLYFNK